MQTDPFRNPHDPGPRRACLRCNAPSNARRCERCGVPTVLPDGNPDVWTGVLIGGSYRLTGPLGAGGMGLIYKARHIRSGKAAAVKLLLAHGDDGDARERFAREAANLGRVEHPNVVQIFDCDLRCDDPYLAMELLQGESLFAVIKREKCLSVARAAHIGCQILAGLAAVHRQGIVHRDLKPENLMLVRAEGHADFIKIIDFGIGRGQTDATITGEGKAIGTPAYMSPEQFTQGELGPRTDLYALGVLLYQCLTGRWPFEAKDAPGLMYAHMYTAPLPLRRFRPDVDAKLEAVLARALEKDPDMRFVDADDMRLALLPFADPHAKATGPIVVAPPGREDPDPPPTDPAIGRTDGFPGPATIGAGGTLELHDQGLPDARTLVHEKGGRGLVRLVGILAAIIAVIGAIATACRWLPMGGVAALPWCDVCDRRAELPAYQGPWCACTREERKLTPLETDECAAGEKLVPPDPRACRAVPDDPKCGCFHDPGSARWCRGCSTGVAAAAVGSEAWCACRALAGALTEADRCACKVGRAVSKGNNDDWCACYPDNKACACRLTRASAAWCTGCADRAGLEKYGADDCACLAHEGKLEAAAVCACETLRTAKPGSKAWCACRPGDTACLRPPRSSEAPDLCKTAPVGSPAWCKCHPKDPICGK